MAGITSADYVVGPISATGYETKSLKEIIKQLHKQNIHIAVHRFDLFQSVNTCIYVVLPFQWL